MQNSFSKVSQFFALYDESVSDGLYQMNRIVSTLPEDDQITQVQTAVNDAYYAVADAAERLHQIYDDVEMSEEEFAAVEKQIPESVLTKLKQSSPIPTAKLIEKKEKDWVVILLTVAAGIITLGGLILAIMAGRLPTNYYINDVQQINFSFSIFLSTLLPYILYGAICLFLAEVCKKAGAALKMFGKK